MITRIDRLLGKEIFERMQDILPRDIGIMVGISDTSGKPITGKRRYETSIICREIINPCLKMRAKIPYHKPYCCVEEGGAGCDLSTPCRGGKGNTECERADGNAGEQAIWKNVTVLYQCFFGLSNYAIPVPIGDIGSIVLYGGQFTIRSSPDEIAIEEFNEYGQKIQISEKAFTSAVLAADNWRKEKKPEIGQHLSNEERKTLLAEYKKENPREIDVLVGEQKATWPIDMLEELLQKRYNLSVFEAWNDFLNPCAEKILSRQSYLNSCMIFHSAPTSYDPDIDKAAREACTNFKDSIEKFFNPEKQVTLDEEYQKAIISLRRALSTIEILKELAILISRTANVMFYKDTYLTLKQAWDNHPLSTVESYHDKWQESETRLKLLGTSGWESPSALEEAGAPERSKSMRDQKSFKLLMGELTKCLMFFAYKLLFDDLRSVISMLKYNYSIKARLNHENSQDLINKTDICFKNIRTASSIFIGDLLADAYGRRARKLRLAGHDKSGKCEELEEHARSFGGSHLKGANIIREELEKYYTQKETGHLELLESKEVLSRGLDRPEKEVSKELWAIRQWREKVLEALNEIFKNKSEETEEILKDDVMLRFFYYIFGTPHDEIGAPQEQVKTQDELKPQNELERIEVNLRWADAEIRNQIQNVSTNMLEFDICQSLLQFVSKLREYVYASRFKVLWALASESKVFLETFMPEDSRSYQYNVDHWIEHPKQVLRNVDKLIEFSQHHGEKEKDDSHNICESPVWQYYVRSAALFHDVGMFSEEFSKTTYGGYAAVRHCHGAFSAKRIVQEEGFALLGNDLDRRIIGQLCAYHQSSEDISCLEKKLKILAGILRIADAFDIRDTRLGRLPSHLSNQNHTTFYDTNITNLENALRESKVDKLLSQQVPRFSGSNKTPEQQAKEIEDQIQFFNQLKRILIVEQENQTSVWPVERTCIDFVNQPPPKKEETSNLTQALVCCGEINAILEETLDYQKHLSVKTVELINFPRNFRLKENHQGVGKEIPQDKRHYLVPVILFEKMIDSHMIQDFVMPPEYQPQVIAKVKTELKREIDFLKPILEEAGIRIRNPRVQLLRSSKSLKERNLLFINAPIATSKMKFVGAPTSLLYAISKISDKIDRDTDFMDVNIEIFDPTCFGNEEKEELRDILRDLHPRIIGISNTSAGHFNALKIAEFIRKEEAEWQHLRLMRQCDKELRAEEEGRKNPPGKAIIVFGGPHENVCFEKTISDHPDLVDISIGGIPETLTQNDEYCAAQGFRAEAEDVLLKIVEKVLEKEENGSELSSIQELVEGKFPLYDEADGKFQIAYLDEAKRLQKKKSNKHALDICTLPNLPRHLLQDSSKYNYKLFKNEITGDTRKTAQVITTRGCIHRCAFCSSVGKVSRRTVDKVLLELEKLREDGYEAIFFDDSTFADKCEDEIVDDPYKCAYTKDPCPILVIKLFRDRDERMRMLKGQIEEIKSKAQSEADSKLNEQLLRTEIGRLTKEKEEVEKTMGREGYEIGKCGYAIKLCNGMMRKGLNFVWGCQTRADVVHDKLLKAMKSAGCMYVYFGIESLNKETLNEMCKGTTPDGIISGVMTTGAEGMNIGLSLVFGLEGENARTETMNSLKDLLSGAQGSRVSCVSINLATIYPGTKLEERIRNAKMVCAIPDFDRKPKFDEPPFTEFEEGGWNILPCCALEARSRNESQDRCAEKSKDLAKNILKQSRTIIGERLPVCENGRLLRRDKGVMEVIEPVPEPKLVATGWADFDRLLYGGILPNHAVALTSPFRDKRDELVKSFIKTGVNLGEVTFCLTTDPIEARAVADMYQPNFYLFVCNPQADAIIRSQPNVFKFRGIENLTDISIALAKAIEGLHTSSKAPRRICIELISDVLLQHHAVQTRKWLNPLITELKSTGFTTLVTINPTMHAPQELQAILDLFDGWVSEYEKTTEKGLGKYLKIERMSNQKYNENELFLKKDDKG